MKLTPLQRELALALYDPQRRFRQGTWDFSSTLWSKALFAVAKRHGKLRPSPAAGLHNIERKFESRLTRAGGRLVSLELAGWRSMKGPDAPARFAQGYKRHRSRGRDLLLTERGLTWVEAQLVRAGFMAADRATACDDTPEPTAPVADDLASCD
ncbi:MAG: hypothetical protein ACI9OJ_001058 [Myxococcota bacterium]